MFVKILLIIIFIAIAVGVGIYTRRAASRDVDGFILGGRNVGPWLSAFAYGTAYFSAVVFIGYAGQFGWKYGMAATWAGIGNAVIGSLLAWWVLGPRTREVTQRLKASTMPEFFGKRYKSKGLRIASAAIIFVFLIPYTASVYNGLSRLFTMAFGVPYEWCVIGMAIVTCIYVVLGGYMATVVNDFLQGIVMLVGITAVIIAVLQTQGGLSEAVVQLSQIQAPGTDQLGAFTSFLGPDFLNLMGVVILTSLGTWGLPQMVQKFYAIKSGPAIKQGAIISTVFAFVIAGGSYFLGGFGQLFGDQFAYAANGTPVYDSIIPTMLSNLPDVLIGLVIVLVLAYVVSGIRVLQLRAERAELPGFRKLLAQRLTGDPETDGEAQMQAEADYKWESIRYQRIARMIGLAALIIIAINTYQVGTNDFARVLLFDGAILIYLTGAFWCNFAFKAELLEVELEERSRATIKWQTEHPGEAQAEEQEAGDAPVEPIVRGAHSKVDDAKPKA